MNELPNQCIIAILRGIRPENVGACLDVGYQIGVRYFEIAMNSPSALEELAGAAEVLARYPDKCVLGAGTVLTPADAQAAIAAGAEFLMSPSIEEKVWDYVQDLNSHRNVPILYIPGALTPTEIRTAYNLGCKTVKIFPSAMFGPEYIRMVKEPLSSPDLHMIISGGVRPENITQYFRVGVRAVAVGSSLYQADLISKGDWAAILRYGRKLTVNLPVE